MSHLHVSKEHREGRQAGVCECVCVSHTHMWRNEPKTDRDKQINRQIEIDRLTARRRTIRERTHELERLREEGGRSFFKITCTGTHSSSSGEWLTGTDRHAYRLQKVRAEREWQRERERQREKQWSAATYKLKQTTERQTRRQTHRWAEWQALAVFFCVVGCPVKHLVTAWFGLRYWCCLTVCLNSSDSWGKRCSWSASHICCLKLSVFGNVGLLQGKSSAVQEIMFYLFVMEKQKQ